MTNIPTIEGLKEPSAYDLAYMNYLDEMAELPSGHSFGLLLFKAEPSTFRIGRDEWLAHSNFSE